MGVRLSLGATSGDILKLVLGHAMKLTILGLLLGVLGAQGLTSLLNSLLYGIASNDPATFIAVPLVLGAIGFVAAYIPARRAIGISPVIALRADQ